MKARLDSNVMAVLLFGLVAGQFRMPRATDGNRTHTERAPAGSEEEAMRIGAACQKREVKRRKRAALVASQAAKGVNE